MGKVQGSGAAQGLKGRNVLNGVNQGTKSLTDGVR